jgi:glyoxylase-like metal-dependent hydrolase (beta-lactamase superfamily II)
MKMLQALFAAYCFIFFTAYPPALSAGEFDWPLERITDKIYAIYGPFDLPNPENRGFRNTAVIVLTTDGVVVFDPGGSAWAGERIAEKIKTLTDEPIVAVFNSHVHGDHWLGNEGGQEGLSGCRDLWPPQDEGQGRGDGRSALARSDQSCHGRQGRWQQSRRA